MYIEYSCKDEGICDTHTVPIKIVSTIKQI